MTTDSEDDLSGFLWDPAGPPDAEVLRIERLLATLRFDPATTPLSLEPPSAGPAVGRWVWRTCLAAAATLLLVAGAAALRWGWPEGRAWTMTVSAGGGSRVERLEVGRERRFGPAERAHLEVARIGSMEVDAGTAITLRATASNRHRLMLARGAVRTRIWAPPGAVVITTPAGDVIDLGCIYRLRVDAGGTAGVTVESGWVQLENVLGEALVPAGASSEMEPGAAPLVPVFDDAAEGFREGVRGLQRGAPASPSLEFAGWARARDAITLITLSTRVPPDVGRRLLARAAALAPPPPGVSLDDIVRGDREQLWRWHDALDLPAPKRWWLNWHDALEASR